jgi:hypothetical protein
MTESEADRDLRELFAAARKDETPRTPDFRRVRRGRGTEPEARRWWPALTTALAAGAVALLLFPGRAEDPTAMLDRIGPFRSATDFLLDVSGSEFLETVPTIGRPEGWFPLTEASEGQRL